MTVLLWALLALLFLAFLPEIILGAVTFSLLVVYLLSEAVNRLIKAWEYLK